MEHFRILPTDKRYIELRFEQKELLFLSFLTLPTDEEYRSAYLKSHKAPTVPDEILADLGYDLDEIEKIQKELTDG